MQTENLKYDDEIDFLALLGVIKENRKVFFGFIIAGIILGIVVNYLPSKYKGTVIIEVGSVNGNQIETAVQTAEKIKTGFYGNNLSLSAENIQSTNLVKISITSFNKEEIQKSLDEAVKDILSEQNQLIERKRAMFQQKIEKSKQLMSHWLSVGQQIMPLQMELLNLESATNDFVSSSLVSKIEIISKKVELIMSIILGFLLGLILGPAWIFTKKWWKLNSNRI